MILYLLISYFATHTHYTSASSKEISKKVSLIKNLFLETYNQYKVNLTNQLGKTTTRFSFNEDTITDQENFFGDIEGLNKIIYELTNKLNSCLYTDEELWLDLFVFLDYLSTTTIEEIKESATSDKGDVCDNANSHFNQCTPLKYDILFAIKLMNVETIELISEMLRKPEKCINDANNMLPDKNVTDLNTYFNEFQTKIDKIIELFSLIGNSIINKTPNSEILNKISNRLLVIVNFINTYNENILI